MLRTDNSVFKRHYRTLSGLLLGSLRECKHNQYTSAEKRSYSLSSVFSPDPRLDRSLPDLTKDSVDSTATEQEDISVSSNA